MMSILYTILGLALITCVMLITLATGLLGIAGAAYCLIQELRPHHKENNEQRLPHR